MEVDDAGIHAKYFDDHLGRNDRLSCYDFDFALHPTPAFLSSGSRELHLKLEADERVRDSWKYDEARLLGGLEVRRRAR